MTLHPSTQWIWLSDAPAVNASVWFRHRFSVSRRAESVRLAISADSRYRLFLNGSRLADGPARAWPEHALYDQLELPEELLEEENVLDVLVTHWGLDNFQYITSSPGLLLSVQQGETLLCATGPDWQAAVACEYPPRVARFGCQLGFEEVYDARKARREEGDYRPVTLLRTQSEDPHRDLSPSETPPLTWCPQRFRPLRSAPPRLPQVLVTLPKDELFKPDPGNPNILESKGLWCREFEVLSSMTLQVTASFGFDGLYIDGVECPPLRESWVDGMRRFDIRVEQGRHLLTLLAVSGNNIEEVSLAITTDNPAPGALLWEKEPTDRPFAWIASGRYTVDAPDEQILKAACACPTLREIREGLELRTFEPLLPSPSFRVRCALPHVSAATTCDSAPLTAREGEPTLFLLDLDVLSVGYPSLEVAAPAGTVLEGYLVEHIENLGTPDEWIQHTANKQNGFRVICEAGITRWTGKERRGGRFLFLLVSAHSGPVQLDRLELMEATYPVPLERGEGGARFQSSDPELDRMHLMSLRTLRLCMEDTFTDCPTYEQVTWIGDARNEAIFNYYSFGRLDLVRRGIEIGAQSLERFDLVCALGPNRIDFEIPAWSFLWNIQTWEYYWHSGDLAFLERIYPALALNLERAANRIRANGLFHGPGMFDWAPVDCNQPFVTHNQLFLIHALDTTARAADALHRKEDARTFREQAADLRRAVLNRLWVPERNAFADSIHEGGQLSEKSCLQNDALALLYGVVPEGMADLLTSRLLEPPPEFTDFGSPFAKFYMLEALLACGKKAAALDSLYEYWSQMMPPGATTFWEMVLEEWLRGESPQATRSHCHGWSAAPLSLFGQVLLGVEVLEPGFRRVRINPTPWRVDFARGTLPTPLGNLTVAWRQGLDGLHLEVDAPPEMRVESPLFRKRVHANTQDLAGSPA